LFLREGLTDPKGIDQAAERLPLDDQL